MEKIEFLKKQLVLLSLINEQCAGSPNSNSGDVGSGKDNFDRDKFFYYLEAIEHLKIEPKNRIETPNLPSHSHAKYLVIDDNLSLITSYNLLAFAGNGLADDEIDDELGVIITNKKIVPSKALLV